MDIHHQPVPVAGELSLFSVDAFGAITCRRRRAMRVSMGRVLLSCSIIAATSVQLNGRASADIIDSWASLEVILDDQLEMEDFEGLSLHGGTSIDAPNPLSIATAPPSWGILPGVSYASPDALRLYAGRLLGDDSVVLAATGSSSWNTLDITFETPQLAIGLYLVNITGNLDYAETVTLYSGAATLDSVSLTLPSGNEMFFGRQYDVGITAVRLTSNSWAPVDNVTWGVTLDVLAGDFDGDADVDGTDFLALQRGASAHPLSALDLARWRANFGAASSMSSVPEPSSSTDLVLLVALVMLQAKSPTPSLNGNSEGTGGSINGIGFSRLSLQRSSPGCSPRSAPRPPVA